MAASLHTNPALFSPPAKLREGNAFMFLHLSDSFCSRGGGGCVVKRGVVKRGVVKGDVVKTVCVVKGVCGGEGGGRHTPLGPEEDPSDPEADTSRPRSRHLPTQRQTPIETAT